ncbi:MAG: hypothetical protein QOK10_1769 [Pseudonocardiales bacterium]|jgi:hypothetical protein|nr:hypothetical protein [Pseudonocardiales bacterium]
MFTILYTGLAIIAAGTTYSVLTRYRRIRLGSRFDMVQAFGPKEFAEFDAQLEAIAREELRRLEDELVQYLAGQAGHVVVISRGRHGITLELSDGRRLSVRGVSHRTVELLNRCAQSDVLRPESFDRDAVLHRLLLRGLAGAEIEISARNIALTADRTDR